MSVCRLLRRSSTTAAAATTTSYQPLIRALHYLTFSHTTAISQTSNLNDPIPSLYNPISSSPLLPSSRTFAFSSAEEAAAERRRRKRRLRIEPPLHALQRNPNPPPRDPNAPRLPDSTNALVGPRLNLHNRVQSLIRAFDLDNASHLARNAVYTRTRPTVFTCNAIIAAMYRAKRYSDAIVLFKYFFEQHGIVPNVVSYNNLINAHCDEGRVDEALEIYRHIIATAPFSPSAVTYKHLTKGLIDAGRIEDAVDLLREMLNKGHGSDSHVYNNVIKGFLDLGNLKKANEFFSELVERCQWYDGIVNVTFMDWWFKQGKDKEAMENYKTFMDKKLKVPVPTGNALLEVLLRYGKKEAAGALFEQMLDNHTPPTAQGVNSETFNVMVNDFFKEGKFDEAIVTFKKAGTKPGSKPFQMDVAGYNNIIMRFCENEMLSKAEEYFKELSSKSLSPDVTSYRTLIDAYLKAERIDDALRLLHKMVQENLWVVASFGIRVFGELIKNGKAVECAEILTIMGNRDPKPDPSVYDVVVRGLCNASAFDKGKDILEQMMRYGVGVPPALKEFVIEAFTNAGQNQEIESVLDENRWRNTSGPPHVQRQPRMPWGPHQIARGPSPRERPLESSSLPGQASSGQPPMAQQQPFGHQKMAGQMPSGSPQVAGQQALGSHNTARQQPPWPHQNVGQHPSAHHQISGQQLSQSSQTGQQSSWSFQRGGQQPQLSSHMWEQQPRSYTQMQEQPPQLYSQMREQQPLASNNIAGRVGQQSSYQMSGQQPSWSPQMGGQQPSWSSQMRGKQPSLSPEIEGRQPSQSSQMGGQQPSLSPEIEGRQPSWSSQMGGQQPSLSPEMEGRQPSWSSQMGGQQPSLSPKMEGRQPSWSSQMEGRQPSWSFQMGGQQPSRSPQMGGQQPSWSSQMEGRQPSWSSQMGGQQPSRSPQMGGQQPSWSSQVAGHSSGTTHISRHQPSESMQMPRQFDPVLGQQPNGAPEMAEQHSSGPLEWQENHRKAVA